MQVRFLCLVPQSHVAEHEVQALQAAHDPSTARWESKPWNNLAANTWGRSSLTLLHFNFRGTVTTANANLDRPGSVFQAHAPVAPFSCATNCDGSLKSFSQLLNFTSLLVFHMEISDGPSLSNVPRAGSVDLDIFEIHRLRILSCPKLLVPNNQ